MRMLAQPAACSTRLAASRSLPLLFCGGLDGGCYAWRLDLPGNAPAAALRAVEGPGQPLLSAVALREDDLVLATGSVAGVVTVRTL